MIKIIEGNIVDAQTDYIIHQVNCQGEMNTGVAKALRDYDEGIYIHYRNVCKLREFNPELLLGTYDECFIRRKNQEILSLFAQDKYGYDGKQYTDWEVGSDEFWSENGDPYENFILDSAWLIGDENLQII